MNLLDEHVYIYTNIHMYIYTYSRQAICPRKCAYVYLHKHTHCCAKSESKPRNEGAASSF